jgi:hypothetical protein
MVVFLRAVERLVVAKVSPSALENLSFKITL